MTANERSGAEAPETFLYGDTEAVAASGMPVPSLRVLKTARAIQAQKTPKEHGGFKRMWHEEDVLIASIGAAMSEHFAWNIRIVAEAMAKTRPGTWAALTASIAGTISPEAGPLIRSLPDDWYLDLVDRKLLFLRVPPLFTMLFHDAPPGETNLLLGQATSKDTFQMLPWLLGHPEGRAKLAAITSPAQTTNAERAYKLAMATRANALSTASINISMQVRAGWRRLHGLDVHFLQDALPQKGTPNDPPPSIP
ncbi:hypothetical protein [Celeribacter baekdonensis]|uniref:Uncharacterized protein n=1 Tax=Celeribacter baekdonensis TaxID=875171 RepID=A0A2R4M751_9RHOB|nr:hypothetical protein [Celeribacter baekdonensis]AVW93041.1 hypothetical protein DA792_19765 [Celeribacter baekdonensis]